MLKVFSNDIWVYDAEWVPNPAVARLVYGLSPDETDAEVVETMYSEARAAQLRAGREPDDRPYLKTALCQVVSIAAMVRRRGRDGRVKLDLISATAGQTEREIIDRFLAGAGKTKPQLVGYNCKHADLPILLQRAIAHGITSPAFCARPDKPWEGVDYFAKYSDHHIDLRDELSGYGQSSATLHELCVSCGIPGKLDTSGQDVAQLWANGEHARIIAYNQTDVLSEYELLMRVALLSGLVAQDEYDAEQEVFANLLSDLAQSRPHILAYTFERERLNREPSSVVSEENPGHIGSGEMHTTAAGATP